MSEQQEPQDRIEALEREAREAMDRLADERDDQERRLKATELAAERQRERQEERRQKAERKAREQEARRLEEELRRLGQERLALEERAEEEAKVLIATLEELLALDQSHRQTLASRPEGLTVYNAPPDFARELGNWFRGRFNGVVLGIGGDPWEGTALPERDVLTPTTDVSGSEGGGGSE